MPDHTPSNHFRRILFFYIVFILSTLLIFLILKQRLVGVERPLLGFLPVDMERKLRFRDDGTFKISVLEDLHFGEGEDNPPELGWGPPSDIRTVKVINTVLDLEKPDLAILNGDLITGENTHLHNSTHYLDQIVQPLVRRNVPWASTYGNHDQGLNLDSKRLLQREKEKYGELSLTRAMVKHKDAGTTNYVLPVLDSNIKSSKPVLLLWFFDSRGGQQFQEKDRKGENIPIPGYVHSSVVSWFKDTNAALQKQFGVLPSLAFVHIPIFAMLAFQNQGVDQHKDPGINDDIPLAPQSMVNDTYTRKDVPFMGALASTEGLKAVFSGHDHGNDWCFHWNGKLTGMDVKPNAKRLSICFGRHTGYGGYGSWTRGARQILVREKSIDEEVDTWIRLEDGKSSGRIMLNKTYGQDWYPAVNKTFTHN